MGKKHLRYAGHTYEIEPWGGAKNIDTPPTSAESSPVNKKLRGAQDSQEIVHRRFTDTKMDTDTNMEEKTAATSGKSAASTDGSKRHKHETKILNLRPEYGVPTVSSVILPFTMYFSAFTGENNNMDGTTFAFRTTSLADIFMNTLTEPTPDTAYTSGVFTHLVGSQDKWAATLRNFPSPTGSGSHIVERPQFLRYWARMYQAYSVLKCEWELTFHNPRPTNNADIVVGHIEEAYGSSNGIQCPDCTLSEAEHFPDMKFKILRSNADGSTDAQFLTVAGTYYPGQVSEHVSNDEDVQTWTKYTDPTALPTPALTERIKFYLWKAPFNYYADRQGVNVRLSLRFVAQFRDLHEAFRYPAGQSNITLTAPQDIYYSN